MSKVKKTETELLAACEDHLLFLKEAFEKHVSQPYRYKQMAAELRVLVARTNSNKPLLLDLVDQYEQADSKYEECCRVEPYEKDGLGTRPLIRVDQVDSYMQLCKRIIKARTSSTPGEYDSAIQERESWHRAVPLREFIEECVCAKLEDGFWTWQRMILEVSQQMGSAHEDWSIVSQLDRAQNFTVKGPLPLTEMRAHVRFVGEVSEVVLERGRDFLNELNANKVFEARHDVQPAQHFYKTTK